MAVKKAQDIKDFEKSTRKKTLKIIYSFFIFLLFICMPLCAQNIFVLNTYNPSYPWTDSFNLGLQEISVQKGNTLDFYYENLDITRFGDKKYKENFAQYLSTKYSTTQIDAVIGNADQACTFIEEYCTFSSSIPKAYYTSKLTYSDSNILCLDNQYNHSVKKTWELIEAVLSNINTIVLVSGEPLITNTVRNELTSLVPENISLKVFQDFTLSQLKNDIASLPATTAVLYMPVTADSTGDTLIPKQLLSELTDISVAPIFTLWETLLGTGTVGGHVQSPKKTSQGLVKALQDYLETGTFSSAYTSSYNVVDWVAMKKHHLQIYDIPQDTLVINKPQSFYIVHAKTILTISNLILILLFIILLIVILMTKKAFKNLRDKNLELKIAHEKAESLSLHDTLTGLYNRRAMEPMINYEINHKKRFNTPVSLLIADIDFFKKVNDTYGHDVGDKVLKKIAQTILNSSRSTDLTSRWGGEEFLILLANTSEEHAVLLAQKMRTACEKLVFDDCSGITISIGVAENKQDDTFEEWFKKADGALYKAKQTGRNKVVSASGLDTNSLTQGSTHELLLLHLNWRDDYCVGVDTYDIQHKEFFTIANQIINAIVNKENEKKITELLEELFTQTQTHFTDEEKYLHKQNCSLLEHHKKEHTRLIDGFTRNIVDYSKGTINAYDFIGFICNELITEHILDEDKKSFDDIRK